MVIIFIYAARVIFLLFGDHQDNESEKWEMVNSVAGTILINKKIEALWDNNIHTV